MGNVKTHTSAGVQGGITKSFLHSFRFKDQPKLRSVPHSVPVTAHIVQVRSIEKRNYVPIRSYDWLAYDEVARNRTSHVVQAMPDIPQTHCPERARGVTTIHQTRNVQKTGR